jgi:hypothetical protein
MSRNSDAPNVSRRQFLAAASTAVAASSLAVGQDSDSAQSHLRPLTVGPYTVTIKIRNTTISYTAVDGHGQPVNMSNNGLIVQPGDRVTWKVDVVGGKYHLTILFLTTPLMDANNSALYAVSGTESDAVTNKIGGIIARNASGSFKYSVRAVDDTTGLLHSDDPTIIVGRLGPRERLKQAKRELGEVQAQIESIEQELEVIIEELKN